jgi:hypothetical protein
MWRFAILSIVIALALAGCSRKRIRRHVADMVCKTGNGYMYIDTSEQEIMRRMTDDGCSGQIVETIQTDKETALVGCCTD